jgi:general secretion pathway protein L
MSTLLIALNPPGQANAEWAYAVAADNGSLTQHGSASAGLLPALAQVAALVPAQVLSWQRVDLPKAPAARMRAALEGLLEEKLLDEPSGLHFALEPGAKPGTPTWVAVCDKAWLQSELRALSAAGKTVARIVPEVAPLATEGAAQLHVGGAEHQPYVTWVDALGVQRWPLTAFAGAGLDAASADVSAEPAVAAHAEQVLQQKVRISSVAQRWVQALGSPWNLAQFDLRAFGQDTAVQRVQNAARALWFAPQWRALRWATALLLVVNLLGLNIYAWTQSRELAAKRDAVRNVLTQSFPQVKLVVDAPRQMQREVAALRQATGGASERDLDVILTAFAGAAPEKYAQTAIEYIAGEVTLKGLTLSPDELTQVSQRLSGQGYAVRAEGSNLVIRVEAAK